MSMKADLNIYLLNPTFVTFIKYNKEIGEMFLIILIWSYNWITKKHCLPEMTRSYTPSHI